MKIVLIHGWNQSKKIWDQIINNFDFKTVAIDLPGFGNENLISKEWGVQEYTRWLKERIGKLKPNKNSIVLVGHSFGGRIATRIALENPRWLKAIVLSGSPSIYRPNTKTRVLISIYKLLKIFIPRKIKLIFLPKELKKAYVSGLDEIFRRVVTYDQTPSLSKISVPTLLIWGENDTEVPLHIPKEMNNKIKNCKLSIIENAGHNSFLDNPTLFIGYVKKFINEIK